MHLLVCTRRREDGACVRGWVAWGMSGMAPVCSQAVPLGDGPGLSLSCSELGPLRLRGGRGLP